MRGIIAAVCVSEKRGTPKKPVAGRIAIVEGFGVEGDAHGGDWHRQISLLSMEKTAAQNGASPGGYGENILVSGLEHLSSLPVGCRLFVNDAVLEVTQIGKECHSHCRIYERTGDCVMPREGIFARVLKGGSAAAGDAVDVQPVPYRAAVITVSDRAAAGTRVDETGPAVAEMLRRYGYQIVSADVLSDDRETLARRMAALCGNEPSDRGAVELIVTAGGTGLSPRDQTPEATADVAERFAPGIAEAMRLSSLEKTRRAMLSRGVAAVRKRTLIINLPGSPRAAVENLGAVIDTLRHGLDTLCLPPQDCIL